MVTLTNVGTAYDSIVAARGLGFQRLDFRGATQLVFDVHVNKVGTGIQSWQLWNETDGVEIGVIDDASAAGIHWLTATFAVSISGMKIVRVRAKSTNGADDPVFLGASILLNLP